MRLLDQGSTCSCIKCDKHLQSQICAVLLRNMGTLKLENKRQLAETTSKKISLQTHAVKMSEAVKKKLFTPWVWRWRTSESGSKQWERMSQVCLLLLQIPDFAHPKTTPLKSCWIKCWVPWFFVATWLQIYSEQLKQSVAVCAFIPNSNCQADQFVLMVAPENGGGTLQETQVQLCKYGLFNVVIHTFGMFCILMEKR